MLRKLIKFHITIVFVFSSITCSICMNIQDASNPSLAVNNPAITLLNQYSNVLNITKDVLETPSTENLRLIVSKHAESIPYQNFSIFYDKKASDLSIESLQSRLLIQKEGGACYETSELLFNVLQLIGYDIKRVPAFPLNNKPYNPLIPSSHNILLVNIDSNLFLIDVGYGINSVRFPLNFNFSETEEVEILPNERYQLLCFPEYYQLNLKIKDEWASLYRFDRPFQFINLEQTVHNFEGMFTCTQMLPIRDIYIKASILTSNGRIGFYVEPEQTMSTAYKFIDSDGKISKVYYKTPEEFTSDISKETALKIPEALLTIRPID